MTTETVLVCTECGRKYNPEAWDPMGGDCPNVIEKPAAPRVPQGEGPK